MTIVTSHLAGQALEDLEDSKKRYTYDTQELCLAIVRYSTCLDDVVTSAIACQHPSPCLVERDVISRKVDDKASVK